MSLAPVARQSGRPICFDSSPLIDYVTRLQPITTLLDIVLQNRTPLVIISTITLTEAVTRPAISGDLARVNQIVAGLLALPGFDIIDVDRAHAIEAAVVRGQTNLKLPDAAIIATARLANAAALVGNDRQWRHKPLGVPYHHMDDILALP